MKVDLHVDPAITLVAQAHRRILFSVRPKLEADWRNSRLIIERVEKPSVPCVGVPCNYNAEAVQQ